MGADGRGEGAVPLPRIFLPENYGFLCILGLLFYVYAKIGLVNGGGRPPPSGSATALNICRECCDLFVCLFTACNSLSGCRDAQRVTILKNVSISSFVAYNTSEPSFRVLYWPFVHGLLPGYRHRMLCRWCAAFAVT